MTPGAPPSEHDAVVDARYYQVARPGSVAERLVIAARDRIYADFLRETRPTPASRILDVGVSDVTGEAANVLERKYPHLHHVTAVGLGAALAFQAEFPQVAYRQVQPGDELPFPDETFDVATSNAVLEHVGSEGAQVALLAELGRVARSVFVSVPNRFFPVEHHTGIPFLHWSDASFAAACRVLGKAQWMRREELILMTASRLRALGGKLPGARVGSTGIRLGPFSSNLYLAYRGTGYR